MNRFDIKFCESGQPTWPDLANLPEGQAVYTTSQEQPLQLGVLPDGTQKGEPTVCFRIDLADGRTVLFETTARIFISAARAIQVRYEDKLNDLPKVDSPFSVI